MPTQAQVFVGFCFVLALDSMPARTEEVPCWGTQRKWGHECHAGGQFNLVWCGKEDCKNDAARRRGHWVTGNTGGISCLECSRPYQTNGQLNKALAKTLNKGICADCTDAGVPEEAPEWYTAPEKPERKQAKTTTTAEAAWNAHERDAQQQSAKWKPESWGSNDPWWGSTDPWAKPSNPEQVERVQVLEEKATKQAERIQALESKTRRQEESLEELADRVDVLEEKRVAQQAERNQVLAPIREDQVPGGPGSGAHPEEVKVETLEEQPPQDWQ